MVTLVLCGMPKLFRQEIQLAVSAAKVVSDGGGLEMRGEVTVETSGYAWLACRASAGVWGVWVMG